MSSISQIAAGPWLEYSMYTLENRAIPSMIDGLKPVQRFIMYSAIKNAPTKTTKVTALAGPVAEYGYHHGEQNAQGAAMLMAANWCNNQPLLEGDGNFGNRLINEGAAARYVFARVHPMFWKLYNDFDLCPKHEDDEHIPPKFYLPKIPMVLINGIKGIATGFATDILPYSVKDVTKLCLKAAKGEDISKEKLVPTFPGFKGKVQPNERGGFDVIGTYERQGSTGLTITEIPFEFDRESYIKVLDDLEENQTIVRYDDMCDEHGFKFAITLKRNFNGDIVKTFKLSRAVSENIVVLDREGKLKIYKSPIDLIKDFVAIRKEFIDLRIKTEIETATRKSSLAEAKIRFIQMVLDDKINFKGKSKAALTDELSGSFNKEHIPTLLGMSFYTLTADEIAKQANELADFKENLEYWESTDSYREYVSDLNVI